MQQHVLREGLLGSPAQSKVLCKNNLLGIDCTFYSTVNDSCPAWPFLCSHRPHPALPPLDLYYIPFHVELLVLVHASVSSETLRIPWGLGPHRFPFPPPAHACLLPASVLPHPVPLEQCLVLLVLIIWNPNFSGWVALLSFPSHEQSLALLGGQTQTIPPGF